MDNLKNSFNKEKSLDDLIAIMQEIEKPTLSQVVKMVDKARCFLQKIHDNAFENGFNIGVDSVKKVEEINENN